ncbi:hypothetical protein CXR27_01485 [Brevibacterium aurantiacum]|uniref:Uncharacterized protein n=1 Tax=Brevibacterium aurantiacum TaxID=273384 RepID=A0A2A3X2S9_BREAU|nr:hypothetical protein CXR27_01485 [Brevibacterium aurantiacum]PCC18494.1 hypothetical protein CIK79_09450 [Brevibacterium aurantiacum]RCS87590.1 hypothetical protein CIK63_13075 [Brevibacterium aurantiacum]
MRARLRTIKKFDGLAMNRFNDVTQIILIVVTDLDQSRSLLKYPHEDAGVLTTVRARIARPCDRLPDCSGEPGSIGDQAFYRCNIIVFGEFP